MRERRSNEQCFRWSMTIRALHQMLFRGLNRIDQRFTILKEAYNLVPHANTGGVMNAEDIAMASKGSQVGAVRKTKDRKQASEPTRQQAAR